MMRAMASPPASTVRARLQHTARRLLHLARVQKALQALQARRRARLATLELPVVMFDSTTPDQIPASAPAVGGYVGGHWPTFKGLLVTFPHAKHLSIAVNAGEDAECLDIEKGDAVPAQAPAWVRRQLGRGVKRPVVYAAVSEMPAVLAALSAAGIPRKAVRLWTAHFTFHPHICNPGCGFGFKATADATQWTDHALGRNLDQSLCNKSFFA